MTLRTVAVDWSGAKEPLRNLWLAEAEPGRLLDVRPFRRRAEVVGYLLDEVGKGSELVVGLDFAFSLPAWFLKERGWNSAEILWREMSEHAEEWLAPQASGRPPELAPRRTGASAKPTMT